MYLPPYRNAVVWRFHKSFVILNIPFTCVFDSFFGLLVAIVCFYSYSVFVGFLLVRVFSVLPPCVGGYL